MTGYTVYYEYIEEHPVPGKPLGRHVKHDGRSRRYPHRNSGQPFHTNEVHRFIPILNQGQAGSCTGNAETGALGSGQVYAALSNSQAFKGIVLDESLAVSLYSAAETIDGDGPYPPNDHGSSGLSVCTAAKNAGYISDFTHIFSLNDLLDALSSDKAVIVGTNWYDSMDQPDSNGEVSISPNAQVRGGHEYLARRIDVERQLVGFDNSWGTGWGDSGMFWEGWGTVERLLSEQGDGTISNPLAVTQ